jgi:hypothetical protein
MRPQWEYERGNFALTRSAVLAGQIAQASDRVVYCGALTQTATKGVLAALGTGPQDAPLSLRNCA